jgi:trans-aconitate methyltransferase
MARSKATITLDRDKAAAARELLGIDSTSEVVDVALDRLIRTERLRADIAAYRRVPPTQNEVDLALLANTSGLADDTDWEALYPEEPLPT